MAQSLSFYDKLKKEFEMKEVDIRTYSPLSLAYIGDSVYDMVVRSYVVGQKNIPNGKLHKISVKYVSAKAQAMVADKAQDIFNDEEMAVYRRGKNAKIGSKAKNASLAEYLKATGVEAVIGYLYLTDKEERILELVKQAIAIVDNGEKE